MADNVAFTPGAGATGATDDIGGVHYPRVKVALGPDGTANDAKAGAGAVDTGTMRVTLASDDPAVALLTTMDTDTGSIATNTGNLSNVVTGDYETIAASQTDRVIGATGATGDYISGVLVIPATLSPGPISIKDGGGSAITIFTGGASSITSLHAFFIPLGIKSTAGAWSVTTGANVSAIASGSFT